MELDGAVGILTGASRGIGPVIGAHLAKAGVRLALVARSEDELRRAAIEIRPYGPEPTVAPGDISDPDAQRNIIDRVCDELGPPSLLINNAGIEHISRFQDATVDDIRRVILTNLFGAESLSNLVLPHMLSAGRGHIVNIGSVGGRTAYPFGTINSSAKHGLVGFTWSLREELRGTGVGVSAVYPTLVSGVGISAGWSAGRHPALLGQVGPEDVARAVLKCVRENRVEITVAPFLERIADVVSAISPRLSCWVARQGGVYSYLRRVADTREQSL